MAGNQTDNLTLLDLTTGLIRTVETGATPDTLQLSTDFELISGANMLVDGNLTVNGTTTTVNSEQVNIRDNHLYLNADYTTPVAQTGGIVVNVLPTATSDTIAGSFVAGVPAVSNPTVQTTGTGTFAVGDLVQIAGSNLDDNDGIFEVLSHVGTTLTIRGVGVTGATVPWVVNDFTADPTAGGDIRIVNVNVLEGDSSGNWQTATTTTTTGLTYNTFTTQGVVDLQEAYEQGNTITTSAGEGNVVIAGTELLSITAAGGINLDTQFDADVTVFDVQMTGTNGFSIDGTAASNVTVDSGNLTLSTTTSGNVIASSAAAVDVDATTSMTFDTANAADASGNDITFTAGSSTGGTAGGASIVLTPGDGNATGVAGFVNVTSPADEDEILLQIESTGTNGNAAGFFTGTSDPSGSVTADAGSLFLRDTGAGAVAYLNTSTGSGTTWSPFTTGAGNNLQQAYEAGNTIVTDTTNGDFDVSGTEAISLDAGAASNFTVAAADLTLSTTTSGDVNLTAAGVADIDGASVEIDGTAVSIDAAGGSMNLSNTGGNVLISTLTSGTVSMVSAADIDMDASGPVTVNTTDAADASARDITLTAASSTGGTAAGASIILTPGDGNATGVAGSVDVLSPADEDEALLTLTNTGTSGDAMGMYVGDNSPNASVTADAGSVFFRDTGTTGEMWLNTSTGSGTTWTRLATTADVDSVDLQQAYENGNTIVTDTTNGDFDVSGTEAISLDAGAASNFTVAGANLTLETTTAGNVNVTAADAVNVTAGNEAAAVGNSVAVTAGSGGGANDGGAVTIDAGASGGGATGNGGNVELTGGDALSTDGDGGTIVLVPGANTGTGIHGFVDITGSNDEDEVLVRLSTTGTNGDSVGLFVGDSDPSGAVTADAGSLFFRDTGTGAELYLNISAGSGTTWTELSTGGTVTLQNAYVNGNTIVTDTTNGDFDVSGTEAISLDAGAASNFTVAAADLTLAATGAGEVLIDGDSGVELNSLSGPIDIGNDANTGAINIGTGAAARTITVGNATGATSVNFDSGTGAFAFDSTVAETAALMTLTTTGANGDSVNFFVGDSDPSGTVTGLAGSLFFRDTGTTGEVYINTSTGSGTAWAQVATGGSVTLQNAYEGGNTIVTDTTNGDFDVSGTEAISLDAAAASNFTVAGANLTLETTTSGTVDITSASDIQMTFATNNATAMVIEDGTNNFLTFDSTTGSQAVEVNQFLDITSNGSGITLTAGAAITAGALVTIEDTTGDIILADSNTGTAIDGLCIGVAAEGAAATNPVKVYTVPGSLVEVNFAVAPPAARNGDPVYVSQTAGVATMTPPTGSGNVVYIVGILQGADGVDTSPLVVYQPQFIAIRP